MDYAIIKLGNKQHRVRDGETLVVDRLPTDQGESFEPVVLLGDEKVTARIVEHARGPKLLIGKYRKRTGYKRHNGFRAATTRVEITIGAGTARAAAKPARAAKPAKAAEPVKAEELEAVEPEATAFEAAAVEAAPVAAAPEAEAAAPAADTAGLPAGYADLTVAAITAGAKDWSAAELEAALAYEQAGAARKGAVHALESAIAKEEAEDGA
jgi:large subunit ribosomal protein L21